MNVRNRIWTCALGSLVPLLLTAASCPPPPPAAIITFDQVGACNGYQETTGPGGSGPHMTVSAGPGAAFVAFRVVSIDNSKTGQPFQFDPDRIFVSGSSPEAHLDSSLTLAQAFGLLAAAPITVPAGSNQGNSGIAVATVSTGAGNPAAEANTTSYFLSYAGAAGDPPVSLAKRNSTRTAWPVTDDCRAIGF